jgi:probable HAF family extracellular repeat protein
MQDLHVLSGGLNSQGRAISADNSIIVGTSDSATGAHAFIWTHAFGMVDLNTYLSSLGLDLTGWTLTQASGISADGSTIVGYGDFNGAARAFLVSGIPAPIPGDFNANGIVDAADYVAWRKGLGAAYTQDDYNAWRTNFGRTAVSGAGAGAATVNAVIPEPSAFALFFAAALVGRIRDRREALIAT